METCSVNIGKLSCDALIAISAEECSTGLMHRDPPLPPMVFVFGKPQINQFWMKSTKDYLDILFCLNNKVVSINTGEPYSTKIIGGVLSDIVIELPHGICAANNIIPGNIIDVKYSSDALMKIFLRKNGLLI
jgi:uncharacterized membrane protein (UPF0127 family)